MVRISSKVELVLKIIPTLPLMFFISLFAGQDDTVVLLLEPLHGLLLLDLVVDANLAALVLLVRHTEAWPSHHDVEVHAVDADARVVLDAQVDVLLNAKAEVA